MKSETINPQDWLAPKGYSNGVLAAGTQLLFVAGQIGWDAQQRLISDDFAEQFGQAIRNVVCVVKQAGGEAVNITRLLIFVTDKREYIERVREVGVAYREAMGKHFPAMSLVEVQALLEDQAKVEIEAIAVL